CDVGARGNTSWTELDQILASRDLLPHVLGTVEAVPGLVHVGNQDDAADADHSHIGLLETGDEPEERRLAGAVRADDAHDAAGREVEGEPVDEDAVAIALRELLGLDHEAPEPRPRGDRDLGDLASLLALLPQELFVSGDAGLALRLPRARRHPYPLELAAEGPLPGRLRFLLEREPLAFL